MIMLKEQTCVYVANSVSKLLQVQMQKVAFALAPVEIYFSLSVLKNFTFHLSHSIFHFSKIFEPANQWGFSKILFFFQVKFSMYFLIFGIDKNNIIIIVVAGVSFDPRMISDETIQLNHLQVCAEEQEHHFDK